VGLDVYGVDIWQNAAADILREYPEKGSAFLTAQGKKLVQAIKQRTPVGDTRKLKRSWRQSKPKERWGAIKVEVKSLSPYAHLIEYGHRIVARGPEEEPEYYTERVLVNRRSKSYYATRKKRKKTERAELGFVPGTFMLKVSYDEMVAGWDRAVEDFFADLIKELEI